MIEERLGIRKRDKYAREIPHRNGSIIWADNLSPTLLICVVWMVLETICTGT